MIKLRNILFPALLSLAACGGGDHASEGGSPMGGNWTQDTGSEKEGMTVTFDGHSDKVMAHLAPRPDGTHGHASGTYTYDDKTKAVTVKCKLMGDDKADSWTGKVDGDKLELGAADTTLKFHKGGAPEGH